MNVGIIGTGNMGGMLARSLVRFGAVRPGQLWAANRSPEKLHRLTEEVPDIHPASPAEVTSACPVVFLCVKPAETSAALAEIRAHLSADHLLVLLSNMLDIADMEARVPARVAKVIPSLVQQVAGGVVLLMYGRRVSTADQTALERLLSHVGRPLVIEEHQGRICSDLTSCGPAFISYVLAQMAQAAVEAHPDLPQATAEALVRETALGTARLLQEAGLSFAEVVQRVSVPGGITAEAIKVLAERIPLAWSEAFYTTHAIEESKKARTGL